MDEQADNCKCRDLSFAIEAENGESIKTTLLQKADGSWWLALMREVEVYDLKQRKDVTVEPISVKVMFPRKMDVKTYIPNHSIDAVTKCESIRKVELSLGAEVQLLCIER